MTSTDLAQLDKPKRSISKPGKVTGRLKVAIDHMVHDGLTDNQAAVKTGLTVTAIRLALQRPHVLAYLKAEREVARARICARNIHRLAEIRDAADNMPAVNAIKALEQIGSEQAQGTGSSSQSPGLVVVINNGSPQPPTIEAEPHSIAVSVE